MACNEYTNYRAEDNILGAGGYGRVYKFTSKVWKTQLAVKEENWVGTE